MGTTALPGCSNGRTCGTAMVNVSMAKGANVMKLRIMVLVIATGLLLTTGYAAAENAQRQKMKTCNAGDS